MVLALAEGQDEARPRRHVFVRHFGATPNDERPDTVAIQRAFDAAALMTGLNSYVTVHLQDGIYDVGEDVREFQSAIVLVGDRIRVQGPGTLKLAAGSRAQSVLEIDRRADRCHLLKLTIDGNAVGRPMGRGEGLRIGGRFAKIQKVVSRNTSTAGAGNTYMVLAGANHCVFEECTSINSGENGFRVSGDFAVIRRCRARGYRNKGFTCNSDRNLRLLTIDTFFSASDTSHPGANGLQIDVMGGGDARPGAILEKAIVRNVTVRSSAADGPTTATKFARIGNLLLDRLQVLNQRPTTSVKLCEGLGHVTITNSTIDRDINQDPSPYQPRGTLHAASSSSSGFVLFRSPNHNVKLGDQIVVIGTGRYDGLQEVVGAERDQFGTDREFVGKSRESEFYNVAGSLVIQDTSIGVGVWPCIACVNGVRAHSLEVKRCTLAGWTRAAVELENASLLPLSAFRSVRVIENKLQSATESRLVLAAIRDGKTVDLEQWPRAMVHANEWLNDKLAPSPGDD